MTLVPEFWQTFRFGCFAEVGIVVMSHFISPRLYPLAYPDHKKWLWHTTAAAVFPAFAVPYYAIPGTRLLWEEKASLASVVSAPPNLWLWQALGFAIAHFCVDGIIMAGKREMFVRAMRRPLYLQMMAHHVLSVVLWPYAFSVSACVVAVGYFMATEVTNIFLNTRWFLAERNVGGALMAIYGAIFFLVYTVGRILTIPFAVWVVISTNWTAYAAARTRPVLDTFLTLTCVIPFALNIFWYSLILKGLVKMFKPKPPTKKEMDPICIEESRNSDSN